jgi:AcrR family transcriptional regulator
MPPARKQGQRSVILKKIQAAARELFEPQGYAPTSIEMIARQAEISVGAVYLYFKSKEDLYASLIPHWLEELHEMLAYTGAGAVLPFDEVNGALARWRQQRPEGAHALVFLGQPGLHLKFSPTVLADVLRAIEGIKTEITRHMAPGKPAAVQRAHADLVWTMFVGNTSVDLSFLNLIGPTAARPDYDELSGSLASLMQEP